MNFDVRPIVTERVDGDFSIELDEATRLARRRQMLARVAPAPDADMPIVWLNQVHGDTVVVVGDDPSSACGQDGDALVTTRTDVPLEIRTADCVPVLLWSTEGVIGAAHAGWRGLEAGVVQRTVETMRALGAGHVTAVVGPHLHSMCNEFGGEDLDRLADRFGPDVRAATSWGTPAFDIDAALDVVLREARVDTDVRDGSCTGCDAERWFSHRMRGDTGRMASFLWQRIVPS